MSESCEVYAAMALNKAKQKTPPINVNNIAKALEIEIEEKDGGDRYEGCFFRYDSIRGILLNKSIKSETRKKFTLAHEIGHAEIPTHTGSLYQCLSDDIEFSFKQKEQEKEANAFAAALLMPEDFVTSTIKDNPIGLEPIKQIAERCQTSLVSSALRYIKYCPELALIMLSRNGKVKFYSLAKELTAKKIFFLTPDSSLIKGSSAYTLFNSQQIAHGHREEKGKISLNVWFQGQDYSKYDCYEHAISLPKYNSILSVAWLEEKYENRDFLLDDWDE